MQEANLSSQSPDARDEPAADVPAKPKNDCLQVEILCKAVASGLELREHVFQSGNRFCFVLLGQIDKNPQTLSLL